MRGVGFETHEGEGGDMAKFVSLINWTDQGAKTASDTVARAEDAQKLATEMGGTFDILWTMGQYDIVSISEFADDETAVKFLAKVAEAGNIRSSTMRAFDADEVRRILGD
jgi:uncharacterized protein with GYD domain